MVNQVIGAIAKPDKIQFVSGLPKTRSGKIMRRILRKIAEGELDNLGDISTLTDPGVVEEIKTRKGSSNFYFSSFTICTVVPMGSISYSSSTSSFFRAIHPLVQFWNKSTAISSCGQVPCMAIPPPIFAFFGIKTLCFSLIKFIEIRLDRKIDQHHFIPFLMGSFRSNMIRFLPVFGDRLPSFYRPAIYCRIQQDKYRTSHPDHILSIHKFDLITTICNLTP